MKSLIPLLLSFITINCFAQANDFSLSDPIDIPQAGWNKLQQMKNGNTILLHFEQRKGLVIKVFDNTHKEISSKKHICKIFDINHQDQAIIRGIYEMNGEANLFVEQSLSSKNALILMRFNPTDGSLISEKLLVQSPSMGKQMYFRILRGKDTSRYYVFCIEDVVKNPDDKMVLLTFNTKHEQIGVAAININGKQYDRDAFEGASINDSGNISVANLFSKTKVSSVTNPVYDNYLCISYLPTGSDQFISKLIPLSEDAQPYYVKFSDTDPTQLKIIMTDAKAYYIDYGLNGGLSIDINSVMLNLDKTSWTMQYKWLEKQKMKQNGGAADTGSFHGIPIKMYVDRNGITNIIYEEFIAYTQFESGRKVVRTNLGYIGIAKYDRNSNEIWGITLPKQQSVRTFFSPLEIISRGSAKSLFRHLPEQDYVDQFNSVMNFNGKNGLYIFYNDYASNFNNTTNNPNDAVSQQYSENVFQYTDAFYYKMNEEGDVAKNFLFPKNDPEETKANMLESGDYDSETNIYATVILERKGKAVNTRIAWCHLN